MLLGMIGWIMGVSKVLARKKWPAEWDRVLSLTSPCPSSLIFPHCTTHLTATGSELRGTVTCALCFSLVPDTDTREQFKVGEEDSRQRLALAVRVGGVV